MRAVSICCVLLILHGVPAQSAPKPVPVLFDTDIGTDIDDAYALALFVHRPDFELLGVTTVSSDAVARARLAAKLLAIAGGRWARFPSSGL